ncbi:MAG: phytanoyl-CoA dioxygenase family protein [Candidatus Thalassarchaeaceae archaeon]|jgi:ectoine hydroxylase-related dioxygenase (phytanoyl-CoA dioxygenase family)|nr:phytanoyl-CoA dioxygenase family protein [Candidatus Thalassarchaeaceae archaeon]
MHSPPRLNDSAKEHYKEQGWWIPSRPLFSDEKFSKLKSIFEELLANKPPEKLGDQLDTPHFFDNRLFEFLLDEQVLDLVEDVLGPNIGLWSSHFISKEPLVGRRTPWHEDSSYWSGRIDRMDKIVTLWLAIDSSDRENGCMRVIPETHNHGFSDYVSVDRGLNTFPVEIIDDQYDESKAVDFVLKPNHCSMHDGRIIHGADPNTSPRRRCGYTMRYIGLDSYIFPEENLDHKVWWARGENVAGNELHYHQS